MIFPVKTTVFPPWPPPRVRHFPLQQGVGGGRGAEEGVPQEQPQGVKANAAADGDRLGTSHGWDKVIRYIKREMAYAVYPYKYIYTCIQYDRRKFRN